MTNDLRRARSSARRPPIKSVTSTAIAVIAIAVGLAFGGVAMAAGPPSATTSAASNITATGATLNGTVFPNHSTTNYQFQYGLTPAYGAQTPTQGPISGNAGKSVSAPVTGLMPNTTYHFRLVATNPAGTSNGADVTFTTTAGPGNPAPPALQNTVTISATPSTLTFGGSTTIAGQVTGPGNAGVQISLEANPFPYTGGFKPTGLSTTTSLTGAYSFATAPRLNTQYRVTAKAKPTLSSPPTAVTVRLKVAVRVSTRRPHRGQSVRFSGAVTPAQNGKLALIQKRTKAGAWRTVASARLVATKPVNGVPVSKFSKRLRISRTATYRVAVKPANGAYAPGSTAGRRLRVR